MSEASVSTPIQAYDSMAERWRLPRALMGGTWALRAIASNNLSKKLAGTRITASDIRERAFFDYLPKDALETDERYLARISRSVLLNRYKDTVRHLVGKPFGQPISLRDDNPAEIEGWSENIDQSGRNLTVFARDVFEDAWVTGVSHILVDFPEVDGADSPTRTRAEDSAVGARPYFTHVRAEDLIGWRSERVNGRDVLTQIRIQETALVPEGEYGERLAKRVRVLYPDRHEVWEEDGDSGKYVLVSEGAISLGFIPLVTVYTGRTKFMEARPPLEDLAFTNLMHFQSGSDQRNILHVARVPILFGQGMPDDENSITVGADSLVTGPQGSDLKYVELTGKSIEAGEKDLQRLDDEMVALSLQPQLPRTGGVTATATAMAGARADSQLKGAVEGLRDALELATQYAGRWIGEGPDWAGSIDIYRGFELGVRDAQTVEALLKARIAGEISRETWLKQLKRYELVDEDFDVAEELERLEGESAQPGPVGTDRNALREAMRAQGLDDESISAVLDQAGGMAGALGSAQGQMPGTQA